MSTTNVNDATMEVDDIIGDDPRMQEESKDLIQTLDRDVCDYKSLATKAERQLEAELNFIHKSIENFIVDQYDDHSCLKLNMEQLISKMNESITQVAELAKKHLKDTVHKMYKRESCIRNSVRSSCNKAVYDCRSALRLEHDLSVEALSAKYQFMEREARTGYQMQWESTMALLDQSLEQRSAQDKTILDLSANNIRVEQELDKLTMELDEERESNAKDKQELKQEMVQLKKKEVDDVFKIISLRKAVKNSRALIMNKSHKLDFIQRRSMDLEQKLHVSNELRHLLEKRYHDNRTRLKLYEEGKLSAVTKSRLLPPRCNKNHDDQSMVRGFKEHPGQTLRKPRTQGYSSCIKLLI